MGSALSCPLSEHTEEINLWGTWLDDELIDGAQKGMHPRIRRKLPENVRLFRSEQLSEAVKDADLIIMAVSSEGFEPVFNRLLEVMDERTPLLSLTKGFINRETGVSRISAYAEEKYSERFPGAGFLWGSIGGPVKAVELAAGIPTHSVYGLKAGFPAEMLKDFQTPYYRVSVSDDVCGVETCSALKNAYAIALGICDGLYGGKGFYYDNIKAFFLSQAVIETAVMVEAAGGRKETAYQLAGTGDLYVTAQSGRNKVYGTLLGEGKDPQTAVNEMLVRGDIAEGYHSIKYGKGFIEGLGMSMENDFPMFAMLYGIIFRGVSLQAAIDKLISKTGL